MNLTDTDFIAPLWYTRPASEVIIEVTIVLPIVLFGLFGNALSIYILLRNKHIRSPTNLLIGNMALADLLSLATHPWVVLIYDLCQNYVLGAFGCRSEGAFECLAMVASVVSVSVISYDRLTAIALPHGSRLSVRSAKVCMVAAWAAGILLSVPLSIYRTYREREWKNFLEKFCKENALIINTYWFVIITVLVWLPLSIQLICYVTIFIKLNKYEKIVLRKKLQPRQVNFKKKAIRMMFTVILTFMLCRIPFTVLILYRHEAIKDNNINTYSAVTSEYHTLWFAAKLLIFVNAALNPLIYSVTNEHFRRGFRTTHLSKWLFPPQTVATAQKTVKTETVSMTRNRENLWVVFWKKNKCTGGIIEDKDGDEVLNVVHM